MLRHSPLALVSALAFFGIGCHTAAAPPPVQAPVAQAATPLAAPGCVRIQRGVSGDIADTRIAQRWPDASYGDQHVAFAGQAGDRGSRHMLVGFDLRSIPKDAIVSRAVLTLQKTGGLGADLSVHRVTSRWDERTATYRGLSSSWDAASEPVVQTGGEGCHGPMTVDLTSVVREWASGASENNGLLLSSDAGIAVATSEADDVDDRPRLEVCFTLPGA